MLAELASNDGMQSSQLAEQTGLDRAQTSRAVTSLVIKGFVVREPRPSDRREVPLRLSEKGLALYERLLPRVAALNRDLVSVLSQTEADALDAVLRRLQAQAQSAD